MGIQIYADGATETAVYEHSNRAIEWGGLPLGGWDEITGGGITREGQTYVRGADGSIRGTTDGNPTPEKLKAVFSAATWYGTARPFLDGIADGLGIAGLDKHQKVEFQIVDQYRAVVPGKPAVTHTTTVKISTEKPITNKDGTPFQVEVELMPTGLPTTKSEI